MKADNLPIATLGLFSKDLVPAEVDRIVGVHAERSAKVGEPLFPNAEKGRQVTAKKGTWFISTDRLVGRWGPIELLQAVIDLVETHIAELRRRFPDLKVSLSLLVHDPNFSPDDLPQSLIRRAGAIGELEIETPANPDGYYFPGPPESERETPRPAFAH